MKTIILSLTILMLTACDQTGSSDSTTTATPTTPNVSDPANNSQIPAVVTTPPVVTTPEITTPATTPPVTTPTAPVVVTSPGTSSTPTAPVMPSGTTKTSSYNGYTCALQSDGNIWCSDGSTAVVTTQGAFVDVIVGNNVACGIQRQQTPFVSGLPQNCSYLSNGSCTKPATYYDTYCWSGNLQAPVQMQTQLQTYSQVQSSGLTGWITGPLALSLDSSNRACINQGVYNLHSTPSLQHTQTIAVCGTIVGSNGYLQ